MIQLYYILYRKEEETLDKLVDCFTENSALWLPAKYMEYWAAVTKGLFSTPNPVARLIKAVSTQWYCNRHGIRDAYRLAVSEKVLCATIQ